MKHYAKTKLTKAARQKSEELIESVLEINCAEISQLRKELIQQPITFYQEAIKLVDLEFAFRQAKLNLKLVENQKETQLRETSTERVTEKLVDNFLMNDQDVIAERDHLIQLEFEVDRQKVLVEALKQRKDMLVSLSVK